MGKIIKKLGTIFILTGLLFVLAACDSGELERVIREDVTIVSVAEITGIEVEYGTDGETVIDALPGNVAVTLSNGEVKNPELTWEGPEDYNGETPDTYTFVGYFTIEEGSGNVEVSVTVLEEEIVRLSELDEDFNTGLPDNWEINSYSISSETWKSVADFNGNTLDGTAFMIVDSDAARGVLEEELISPVINSSLSEGEQLLLSFDHYFDQIGSSLGKVYVYDGSEWIMLTSFSEDTGTWGNPAHEEINISQYANENLRVCFYYTGDWEWFWAIDNVIIGKGFM